MKKRYIVAIIIVLLIILSIGGFFVYNIMIENGRKYEIAQIKQYNYFVLKQQSGYGVIDKKGNIIVESEYEDVKIPNPEKAVFVCYTGNSTKILNERREEILNEYSNVEAIRLKNISSDLMYEKTVLKYSNNGKYGLIDLEGKEVTKPIYDELDSLPYKEGELLVRQENKYGVINIKGNKLVDLKYETIAVDGYYTDANKYKYAGYIVSVRTEQGYRYGYIDINGKEIIKPEYNELSRVTEIEDDNNVYLLGAKNGQYGLLKNSQDFVRNEYQSIRYDTTNKVFVVEKSKKYGIVNMEGNLIVPVQYNQIDITGIYLYALNNQGTTVYNSNGSQVNVNSNVAILNTSNEKYKIRINNEDGTRYGVINKEGKQLIEEKYNYLEYLYNNYFIVSSENGKLGVINDKDEVIIGIDNDSLQKVQNTDLLQATITANKITKIYSNNMEILCEMKDAMIDVKNDYVRIYSELENKYFSKDGKELKNTDIYSNNKLFTKMENNKWGFVDNKGNVVVDYKYDKVTEFNEYGYAAVKIGEKWGVINEQGKEVLGPTYEIKDQLEPSFIGKYYQVKLAFGEVYYTN